MFSPTWNKYVPVIRILLKRSLKSGEEQLSMNQTDFSRAAGGKKVKFAFQLKYRDGRLENAEKASPIARNLAEVLGEDETIRKILKENNFAFGMNNLCQLSMRHKGPVEQPPEEAKPSEEPRNEESG